MCCWSSTDGIPGPPSGFGVYGPGGATCADVYRDANFPDETSFAHSGVTYSRGRYFRNRDEGCFTLPWDAASAFCEARGARLCKASEAPCLHNSGCGKWNYFWLADASSTASVNPILPARCINGCAVTGGDYVQIGSVVTGAGNKEYCISLCENDMNCVVSVWHETQTCKMYSNPNMPVDQSCGDPGTGVTWQPGGDSEAFKYYTCIKHIAPTTHPLGRYNGTVSGLC